LGIAALILSPPRKRRERPRCRRAAEQRDELAPFLKALGAGRPTIFRDREHVAAAISLSFSRETWGVTVSALKIGEISGSF